MIFTINELKSAEKNNCVDWGKPGSKNWIVTATFDDGEVSSTYKHNGIDPLRVAAAALRTYWSGPDRGFGTRVVSAEVVPAT